MTKPDGFDDWLHDMRSMAKVGMSPLTSFWKSSEPHFRAYLIQECPARLANIKSTAQAADRRSVEWAPTGLASATTVVVRGGAGKTLTGRIDKEKTP
jgi:hypothetical protein